MTDARVTEFAGLLATKDDTERATLLSQAKMLAMNGATEDSINAAVRSTFLRQADDGLADLLRDGVPPPTFLPSPTLGEKLFYSQQMFLFAGHKKAGKSWAMTLLTNDVVNAGRPVVYIDNENGRKLFAKRLALVNAREDRVRQFLSYVSFPDKPDLARLRGEFEALAEEQPGSLVVLDSLRTFMAHYGLDPNKDVDVERFLGPIMGAVKTEGLDLTVGIIDHSNRTTKEGDQYAAAGSFAKPAAVDTAYFFDKVEKFSQEEEGVVRIDAVDDRDGLLDFNRFYRIGGQGIGQPLFFKEAQASSVGKAALLAREVWQYLADHDGVAQTKSDVRKKENTGVGGNAAKEAALVQLVENPDVPVYEVPGRTPRMPSKFMCDVDRWEREKGAEFDVDAMDF